MSLTAPKMPSLQPDKLYSAKDITSFFGIHLTTLYSWRNSGRFPEPQRIGPRTVRWTGRQILDHLEKDAEAHRLKTAEAQAVETASELPW